MNDWRGFARCGRERLDEWADAYRIEHRLPLARLILLLSLPDESFRIWPQYLA